MYRTSLRKVGGSVMLAIPPAILDLLELQAGSRVELGVEGDRLVVEQPKPRYQLDELLAKCDASAPLSAEDEQWLREKPTGSESL
ncbi:MAG TPA: AbrB/MazE/SpoVT family DNA-binding domain-containing protein [Zeimonas sp.]